MKFEPRAQRILVIGDESNEIRPVVSQAAPSAEISSVPTVFDGIAELIANEYSTVLTAAEPIERRPEAAVQHLREISGNARLLLYGNATLEPLSKKMMSFGVDDYFITPASAGELQELLSAPRTPQAAATVVAPTENKQEQKARPAFSGLGSVALSDIVLEALVEHPGDACAAIVRELNEQVAPDYQIAYAGKGAGTPPGEANSRRISHTVPAGESEPGEIHLFVPRDEEEPEAKQFIARLARALGQAMVLQERHNRLQHLAITDDLTGLYNCRYFKSFLPNILARAKVKRFPVTLFLFDIDNFKKYNDEFGHGVGDEILKQTAVLIKRCVRDHDFVARIGGDEFAAVFWEKDSPRQAHREGSGIPGRPPTDSTLMLNRFRALLASQDMKLLGASGQGSLTISGGLAVYPWDAHSAESLIAFADEKLMFGAKKSGKNSIHLVGGEG